MKIIYNKWFPFGKFGAINICGLILFVKGDSISETSLNHEKIHSAQIKELLYIGFYLWYFLEWLYQGIVRVFRKNMKPYYFISFEQEAYDNESDLNYLSTRTALSWMKYLGKWEKY